MTLRDFPWLVVCTDITVWLFFRHEPNSPEKSSYDSVTPVLTYLVVSIVSIFRARPAALSKTFRRGRRAVAKNLVWGRWRIRNASWSHDYEPHPRKCKGPLVHVFTCKHWLITADHRPTTDLQTLHWPPFEYFCKLDPFHSIAITFSIGVPILKAINAVKWKWSALWSYPSSWFS